MIRVALIGATGFVGSATNDALKRVGDVRAVTAPRLRTTATQLNEILADVTRMGDVVDELAEELDGSNVVVNAAGVAAPESSGTPELFGGNALLPAVVAAAGAAANIARMIHVSTAAVSGRSRQLEPTLDVSPISAYGRSKLLGELSCLRQSPRPPSIVVLRPTSVHGRDRSFTQSLVRFARSPVSCVAGDGSSPTPQVLVENVAAAVAFLTEVGDVEPPEIVLQPWEGHTTGSLLRTLGGGREPHRVPASVADTVVRVVNQLGGWSSRTQAFSRRLELLWFGQAQQPGWLEASGFTPPFGREHWIRLASSLAA